MCCYTSNPFLYLLGVYYTTLPDKFYTWHYPLFEVIWQRVHNVPNSGLLTHQVQVTDTVIGSIMFTDSRDKHHTGLTDGSTTFYISRSQWPCCLRRRSATARLLKLRVRIPPGPRMFVSCKCCMLSGRGLCDELITRTEESYRLWCVVVGDIETSKTRRPWPALGLSATKKKIYFIL